MRANLWVLLQKVNQGSKMQCQTYGLLVRLSSRNVFKRNHSQVKLIHIFMQDHLRFSKKNEKTVQQIIEVER